MFNAIRLALHVSRIISHNMSRSCNPSKTKFVWIDLEMTGLDVNRDHIMEVACIISNPDLNILDPGLDIVLHLPDETLANMSPWCIKQHGKSGLTEACRRSKLSVADGESQLREYITKICDSDDTLYMAGNTVYMDKLFIDKIMPSVSSLHHYRLLDVSSIKILAQEWYAESKPPKKKLSHRALDDLHDSINELRAYRKLIFRQREDSTTFNGD